jgi:hypothetical protein
MGGRVCPLRVLAPKNSRKHIDARLRYDGLVRADVTARPHQVKGAQILKSESIARRRGRSGRN